MLFKEGSLDINVIIIITLHLELVVFMLHLEPQRNIHYDFGPQLDTNPFYFLPKTAAVIAFMLIVDYAALFILKN